MGHTCDLHFAASPDFCTNRPGHVNQDAIYKSLAFSDRVECHRLVMLFGIAARVEKFFCGSVVDEV